MAILKESASQFYIDDIILSFSDTVVTRAHFAFGDLLISSSGDCYRH